MNAPGRPATAVPLLTAILMAAVPLTAAPAAAQTTSSPSLFTPKSASSGFYVGAEGGLNWLLNDNSSSFDTGFAVGGVVGYDFVGPRFELEGVYRGNNGRANFANSGTFNQLAFMANGYYDFLAGATLTPYVGAGIGLAFVDGAPGDGCSLCNTEFAYQAIVGMGWNADSRLRINLDARYHGTTGGDLPFQNNDITTMLGVTYKLQ
jgi:OmpA-OmpF porin, OOP family